MKQKYYLVFGVIAVLGLLLIIGCIQKNGQIDTSTSSPITTEFHISKTPKLNEPVILTLKINSAFDAPNSEATIEIPEGAIKLEGDLSWKGDLMKNLPVQISAKIKFIREGDWTITGSAKHIIDESNYWGDIDYIYLCIKEDFGKIGFCEKSTTEKAKQVKEEHEACPQGYEWNAYRKECVSLEHETCPEEYIWNSNLQKCVLIEHEKCPVGYIWDEISQSCQRGEGPVAPE